MASGGTARLTGSGEQAVVCVNGGSGKSVPGDWNATLEWLVGRLSPRHPTLAFLEVRYRVKSWKQLDWCLEDCGAAIESALARGARAVALLGFSMGGAVSISAAGHPAVTTVIGLAPWIPDQLDVSQLRGRAVAVMHGTLDGKLPGFPGVSPSRTRRGLDRIRALGVPVTYTTIRAGVHGVAVHTPAGLMPLPRAHVWEALVDDELARFTARPAIRTPSLPASDPSLRPRGAS